MQAQVSCNGGVVSVSGEMTIYSAAELSDALFAAVVRTPNIELDLAGVTGMDTAGLQLLLMIRRLAHATGIPFRIANPSDAVAEVLDLCGLRSLTGQLQ